MLTADHDSPPFDAHTEATLLAEHLVAALVNSRIYAVTHPRVAASIESVRDQVHLMAVATGEQSLRIGSYDGMIVYQGKPLLGASLGVARLNERLQLFGAGGIEFDADVGTADLGVFFAQLIARNVREGTIAEHNERLAQCQCLHVRLLAPYASPADGTSFGDPVRLGLAFHQNVMDVLQTITVQVCRGGRIDFGPVQTQAEQVLKRLESHDDLHLGLARQDQYDAFTFGHSLRVAILSLHFARQLTDDRELLVRIGTAALLHDVGKSLIPFEILHSNKPLSVDERREMNRHAELGAECLLDHSDVDPLAVAAAFGHHRTPDGRGYPQTTHRHPVSMVTSIVKICDIFEALTAARPYKQPMSPIRAYRVMLAMGDKLDRRLLRRFIESNGVYPVGQLVELEGGEIAVVRAQTDDMQRPMVALLDADNANDLVDRDEQLLDLSELPCDCARQVLRELTPDEANAGLAERQRPSPQHLGAQQPGAPQPGAPR